MDDAGLIAGYVAGEPECHRQVDRWIEEVLRRRALGLGEEREDVGQEARRRLLVSLRAGRFEGRCSLRTYVWRLAQAEGSPIAGKVGVTEMVHTADGRSAGTLGGWGLGISRFSRRPGEALAFIRHAASLEGQRALCRDSGYAPALLAAYEDPELLAANPFLAELRPLHAAAAA